MTFGAAGDTVMKHLAQHEPEDHGESSMQKQDNHEHGHEHGHGHKHKDQDHEHKDASHHKLLSKYKFLNSTFGDILKCRTEIRIMFRYILHKIFCNKAYNKNTEVLLIDKAINMIKSDTDIINLLDKIQEIDKLKKIFFTENQARVFNFSPKPIVTVSKLKSSQEVEHPIFLNQEDERKTRSLLTRRSQHNSLKSLHKLYRAYDHLYHQNNISKVKRTHKRINRKLMILLGPELRAIFETSYLLMESSKDQPPTKEKPDLELKELFCKDVILPTETYRNNEGHIDNQSMRQSDDEPQLIQGLRSVRIHMPKL